MDSPATQAYVLRMKTAPVVRFLDRNTPPHIATLILLAGLSALNMSIFVPSLDRMAVYFDTEYGVMQLAISGYLFATAFVQLFIGPISDRFGRRKVVLVSLAIFVAASAAAIFTTSIFWFLFFRMMQAIVATAMVLSRAIVRDIVPQNEAASMIGYVTMGMALVPMFGPTIGGLLDQLYDWRASFVFLTLFGAGVGLLCLSTKVKQSAMAAFHSQNSLKVTPNFSAHRASGAIRSPRPLRQARSLHCWADHPLLQARCLACPHSGRA